MTADTTGDRDVVVAGRVRQRRRLLEEITELLLDSADDLDRRADRGDPPPMTDFAVARGWVND